jgi:AcrR family transcriptional regulator
MTTTRALNMQKRRARILTEARRIIAEQGFDAFNLRDLAERSELTVPTVYNLIGNKDEILKALILGSFADFETQFRKQPQVPAAELPVVITKILLDLTAGQEDYFRATALASERIGKPQEVLGKSGVLRTSYGNIARKLCQAALAEKLLRGSISSEMLVEQMVATFQLAFRDWAYRIISLEELRIATLQGFYIALAADATPAFHRKLAGNLQRL